MAFSEVCGKRVTEFAKASFFLSLLVSGVPAQMRSLGKSKSRSQQDFDVQGVSLKHVIF